MFIRFPCCLVCASTFNLPLFIAPYVCYEQSIQINGISVLRVVRRGGIAVHVVEAAIAENTEVNLKVDWTRRFDHMQQHSGTCWHGM